ncbi:complement C1q-like protein 3 [Mytilus trossulus]|uniref:complement C1q-like protein 3 n=1 Tax=Mytilus trossulus TaxID=6551 RepID=UPI00300553BF
MASLLREQNEKIRNLENIVKVQKEEINVLTDEFSIVKIQNRENEHEIVKMKETISKLLQKCNDQNGGLNADTNEGKDDNMAIVERKNNGKRLLEGSITPTPTPTRPTAFYAHMSHNEVNAGKHRTLIFDVIKTNINNDYSPYSGIFTVPADGVYVFTLSLRIETGTTGAFEIVKNNDVQGSAIGVINSDSGHDIQLQVSETIVISATKGDNVFVRTHSQYGHTGYILADGNGRSMFAGWSILN